MPKLDEAKLIQGTITDLDNAIATLRSQAAELDVRIREAEARRDAWKARLKQIVAAVNPKERLRKGAALDAINKVFGDTLPGTGLTISEITGASGIAWSSIRNAIKKSESGYYEKHGRWFPSVENRQSREEEDTWVGGKELVKK